MKTASLALCSCESRYILLVSPKHHGDLLCVLKVWRMCNDQNSCVVWVAEIKSLCFSNTVARFKKKKKKVLVSAFLVNELLWMFLC